ncbi:Argonaute siRNA chaperone complex subunit Arb1-domain-containing protein [Xylaria cf. heliscus]|nr:Argonaute siRNA chaperone complex subunit Arb1-domain-containing protein [Xylaria cf. heliscus]
MAELPTKQSEEPMATKMQIAQPQLIDTDSTHAPQEEDNNSPTACGVEAAVIDEDSELDGECTPAVEGPGIIDSAAGARASENAAGSTGTEVQPKKKKKRRSKRPAKSRRNISGFEEYYCDAPVTPAEDLEKKKLYHPTRPFPDRIEECIQRFRARRRMDSQRAAMFSKYLFLGGIDSSQRQFTGISTDKDAMAEADPEQIRTMTAVDFVGGTGTRFYNGGNSEDWGVDFEAVVKGFLSRTITDWYMYDEEAIQLAADLVKNFLNYVLIQDVCPEYKRNIILARNVCDIAPTELRYTHKLISQLPGTFNLAARSLFCEGGVKNIDEDENYEALVVFRLAALLSPSSEEAQQSKEQILKHEDPTTIKVISTTEQTYQVLGIERPRHKDKKMVDEQLAAMNLNVKLRPAGSLRVAPTIIAHGWGNMPRPEEVDFGNANKVEFLLEDELLAMFEVGMKIHVTVCELNIGLRFIKEVHDLRVSFDTFLPQYLMTDWKDPIPNERPPPSIHDLNAEEKAMSAEMAVDD